MLNISRRALLGAGLVTAAAAPFAGLRLADAASWRPMSRATWLPHLGHAFTMSSDVTSVRVLLDAIGDLPHAAAGDDAHFDLTFRLLQHGGPGQDTFAFHRSGFRRTSLFVVPSGQDPQSYRAVINKAPRHAYSPPRRHRPTASHGS